MLCCAVSPCSNAVLHCTTGRGGQPAFLWEGNDIGQDRVMTYQQVLDEVCQLVSAMRRRRDGRTDGGGG